MEGILISRVNEVCAQLNKCRKLKLLGIITWFPHLNIIEQIESIGFYRSLDSTLSEPKAC